MIGGFILDTNDYTYKKYGANAIATYGGVPAYSLREDDDPALKRIMDDVWVNSRPYTGIGLSRLTHRPECAWYVAWVHNYPFLLDEDIGKDTVSLK